MKSNQRIMAPMLKAPYIGSSPKEVPGTREPPVMTAPGTTGPNSLVQAGYFNAWYETAENQSRLGNIFLASCITASMRSATANIFVSTASLESRRATSLMTSLRGSAMV